MTPSSRRAKLRGRKLAVSKPAAYHIYCSDMANVDTHAPGTLCWAELGTTNQDAAKKFYQSVLGWTPVDHPMGPGFVYTMFTLDGRNTGACYTLTPEMPGENVPPNWLLYVSVADADQTASKAAR